RDAAVAAAEADIEQIVAAMNAATVTFRMRGLNCREFRDLIAGNPPRRDNKADIDLGYNLEAVSLAYLRLGCIEPGLTEEQWDDLDAKLTVHQRGQLVATVDALTHTGALSSIPLGVG